MDDCLLLYLPHPSPLFFLKRYLPLSISLQQKFYFLGFCKMKRRRVFLYGNGKIKKCHRDVSLKEGNSADILI
jgi:hypothetical protein